MKIEHQVVSQVLASRLKELGVKQDAYFTWQNTRDGYLFLWSETDYEHRSVSGDRDGLCASAFTVAELGKMLPDDVVSTFEDMLLTSKAGSEWKVWYAAFEDPEFPFDFKFEQIAPTEADARAKMLIYLLENNLISLPA